MSGRPADLVAALAAARKATQFYPQEHPRYVEAIETLVSTSDALLADGVFTLNAHQGRLYAGSDVITDESPAFTSIVEAMESRKVESFTFVPGFSPVEARALTEVLNLRVTPQLSVEEELAQRGVENVRVATIIDENAEEREERDRERERDRGMYRRFVASMRRMTGQLQKGQQIDLAEASSMVPEIIGRLLDNQAAVLGLATIRSKGDAHLYHSINVMIYALTIGAALELPKEGFASLGVAALVHDIGKSAFDDTPEHQAAMRLYHPNAGADILARLEMEDRAPMLVAYEHHMGVDGSGWPEHSADYVPHPYSRMVGIADRYETLTKSAEGPGLTPDRAVVQLLAECGKALDPIFTKLFVQALGVFPIGCWVRLSDQSVGVVCDKGPDPVAPKVRVVFDGRGMQLEQPLDIDVSADAREIVEVVDEVQLAEAASDHL